MTHDELLAKIDAWDENYYRATPLFHAIRAVVELHKPFETVPPWEYKYYTACSACEEWTTDGAHNVEYPCPTIQAIDKELE